MRTGFSSPTANHSFPSNDSWLFIFCAHHGLERSTYSSSSMLYTSASCAAEKANLSHSIYRSTVLSPEETFVRRVSIFWQFPLSSS